MIRMPTFKTCHLLLCSAACLALAACGAADGGASSGSSPAQQPAAPAPITGKSAYVYLTDDFGTENESVWITVQSVVAFNGSKETLLVDHRSAPVTVNLPTLKRSGLLLGKTSVPADTTEIRVYVDAEARLEPVGGIISTVQLAREAGGYIRIGLSGWESDSGTLALDFDLPRFQLANGILQPATRLADSNDQAKWTSRHGEIKGTVRAVSMTSIEIETAAGQRFTIALGDYTSYRAKESSNWRPAVGQRVEADVLIVGSAAQPTFQALSLHADTLFDSKDDGDAPEVEGIITAINGTVLSISVLDAEDIRLAGTADIDVAGARYSRGAASLLAVGQRVELHLAANGSGWRALVVEIEGARKPDDLPATIKDKPIGGFDDDNDDDRKEAGKGYAEVKGQFVSRTGDQVTLMLYKVERAGALRAGDTVTFDLSRTLFTKGALGCLVAGSAVELKGYLGGNGQFTADFAELDGPCQGFETKDGAPPSGAIQEAKGRILSVGTNSFELLVLKVEDWFGPIPERLTIRYDANTRFKDLPVSQLRANLFVEVKGAVSGGEMAAVKIERD